MSKQTPFLSLKDHSVTGEKFDLIYNKELDALETIPRPDVSELPKYYKSKDYISHTGSKRNFFEIAYHLVRSITLKQKLQLINSFDLENKSILDIGCGTGEFLKLALKNSWVVTGVEPNKSAREIANKNTNNKIYESINQSKVQEKRYDVITLWHVLEHLPNLDLQIELLKKLLKPTGRIIVAVPNYNSFDAKHYKSFWAAYDAPRHLWHFSKSSIAVLFAKQNMEIEKTLPMKFDAYYVSILSEKYKKSFLGFFKGLIVGLRSNLNAIKTKEYSSLIYVIKNIDF